jgi:phage shock protein A
MQQMIDDLIKHLSEFKEYAVSLDDIEKQHTFAKNELASTSSLLDSTKAELSMAKSGLSVAQLSNLKEHEQAIFNLRKEHEGLTVQVDAAKEKLATATTEADSAAQRHKDIEASIQSLRSRLG